ncbi:MAG: radical SAM protein [Actinobacteria bacterium]|nr:radical SAM protein [Actinomycetota bacterium]MCG2806942.1 radical SAM protein [Coriobacteriia bacterium]
MARSVVMRRYDLELVVKPESAVRRWLSMHVLRLYYPKSMVSRQSATARLAQRFRGDKPTLFHFEIHITDHCNLNCRGCGHFSNLCAPTYLDLDSFRFDMAALSAKVNVEQLFLLGGEPLLHPQVNDFIRVARERFPKARISLLTNGSLVMRQEPMFWHTLAETRTILLCDAYPIGLPVDEINARGAKHDVVVEWTEKRDLFFKIPLDETGSQDASASYRRCSGINNCPMYKDGRLYPCAFTAYVDIFRERFGVDGLRVAESDSISVRDSDGEAIMRFLGKPVSFCRHCDYDHFEMYEWGKTECSIDEWTRTPQTTVPL